MEEEEGGGGEEDVDDRKEAPETRAWGQLSSASAHSPEEVKTGI